jgi:hypothetical protein
MNDKIKGIMEKELLAGLSMLAAAGLPGRPGQYCRSQDEAAAAAQAAAQVWAEVILDEFRHLVAAEVDLLAEARRLRVAFRGLIRKCQSWPAPADLLAELTTQGGRRRPLKLPPPPRTAEQERRGLAEIKKIKAMLWH